MRRLKRIGDAVDCMRHDEKLRLRPAARAGAVIILLTVMALSLFGQNSGIQYFYDDLGRLIRVVDQNGNVASYSYDAVGNILAITRSTVPSNNGLTILNFTPQSGPVGQNVTIQGQGFSTTPSANAVQFNGVTAVVSAATANSLTVTVPSAATTGLISVTVSGQSASSSTAFTVTAGVLQSMAILPTSASIDAGSQQQLASTGTYANGTQQNLTASVLWSSSNTGVASVSNLAGSQGLVTGMAAGTATITATSGAVIATATVQVAGPVNLVVNPTTALMFVGTPQQFSATATFADGTTPNVSTIATWTSSNSLVATVSNAPGSQGLVTPVSAGTVTICANLQISACSTVTVNVTTSVAITPTNVTIPIGVQQFTAIGTNGQNITSEVTWSSSNPDVAGISNSPGTQGLATGLGVGTTTITANAGTLSASTTLTLTVAVPTITISPERDIIQQGNSFQFMATLANPNGSTQNVTQTASWGSSAPSVATVNSQGLVTAVGVGSTTVTATSASATGSASVIVTNSAQATVPRYLYENNYGSNGSAGSASVYSVNPGTGQLRPLRLVAEAGMSLAFALDPASQYLYVANTSSTTVPNTLAAYTIGANGSLTPVTSSPFATGNYPNAVATDPLGRFVYVVNGSDETLSGFAIDANGELGPIAGSPFGVGNGPLAAVVDPSGQFVYVMNSTDETISAFTIDPNSGSLSAVAGSPFTVGASPQAMTVDPSGKFVLVTNAAVGGGSSSEALPPPAIPELRSTGTLLLALLEPFPLGVLGNLPNVSAGGEAAQPYLFDTLDRGIYAGDDTSQLPAYGAAMRATPSTVGQKLNPTPDCSGGGASVVGRGGSKADSCGSGSNATISVFSINASSGALSPVTNSPFIVSGTADSIVVDPTDRFVYVTYDSNVIDGFAFDSTSGALVELSDAPYTASENFLTFVTVDPSGRYVYASGGTGIIGSDILVFSLNSSTGSLTSVGNIPSAAGSHELAISKGSSAVTFSPQFAYVANAGGTNAANNISGYSINTSTGALSPLADSPFTEGLSPVATTTDPWNLFLYVANNCSDAACSVGAGSVSAYTINSNAGTLMPALGSPYLAGSGPFGITIDPSSSFVYLVDNQDVNIWGYSINLPPGSLSPLPGSPVYATENGTVAVAVDSVGGHAYTVASVDYYIDKCTQSCLNGHLYVYDYPLFGPTTTGEIVPPVNIATVGPSPSSLALDPGGWFALVTDITTNSVYVISTITQSQVTGSPFATGQNPMSVTVDTSGRFVYVANQGSNNVSAYTIDPNTGILTPVPGSPFAAGNGPVFVAVDFSGSFVYVTNKGDNTVSAFSINLTSGALTPVAGSPFDTGTAPVSVVTTGIVQ
jgi:YD repeat-containing protein